MPGQVDAVRAKVDGYLRASGIPFSLDDEGDLMLPLDETVAWIRVTDWEGRTLVRIWSITNLGMRVDGDLTKLLATTNATLVFGGFRVDESGSAVQVVHALLGEHLTRAELEIAVQEVASAAKRIAPEINARFGGKRFAE